MSDTLDKTSVKGDEADEKEDTPAPLPKRKRASKTEKSEASDDSVAVEGNGKSKVEEQAADAAAQAKKDIEKSHEAEIEEARAELEALSPTTEPVRWVIGKPPEHGGKENQYSIYVQDKLPWMDEKVFFSHVARTFANAIKSTGGDFGGMADVFGDEEGGSIIERGRRLGQRDFGDAASFLTLAFELVAYSPMFLVDCYIIILGVPRDDRRWARLRFAEPWDPEKDKWGLKREDHKKIIDTFIDQNYEAIRSFFVDELPAIAKRVMLHERSKDREKTQGRDSSSDQ